VKQATALSRRAQKYHQNILLPLDQLSTGAHPVNDLLSVGVNLSCGKLTDAAYVRPASEGFMLLRISFQLIRSSYRC